MNAEFRRESLRQRLVEGITDDAVRAKIEDAVGRLPVFVKKPSRARLLRRMAEALGIEGAGPVETLATVVDKVLNAPGRFAHWHPHRPRHAYAHRAERDCRDLDSVRTALGHTDCRMTMRYAHVDDDLKARALAERLGREGFCQNSHRDRVSPR